MKKRGWARGGGASRERERESVSEGALGEEREEGEQLMRVDGRCVRSRPSSVRQREAGGRAEHAIDERGYIIAPLFRSGSPFQLFMPSM